MVESKIDWLLSVIDQAFDCESWHGTNLRGSLRRVDEKQAIWRPAPDRHSIWEQVLHAAYWKYTVRRRLSNEKRGSFALKGSNWFEPQGTTKTDWSEAINLLVETHQSMRDVIAKLPVSTLAKKLPKSKVTREYLITGVAAHDLYHAGQIQLLKRLQS